MKKVVWLIPAFILLIACEKALIPDDPENTPVNNFEVMWNTLDTKYSLFETKNIDWDSIYNQYRIQVNNSMTDEELFDLLSEMLKKLKDGHTDFVQTPFGSTTYLDYTWDYKNLFDIELIKRTYLKNTYKYAGPLLYGTIYNTGYIQIENFVSEITDEMADKVISDLSSTDAIIIDLRRNIGGSSIYSDKIVQHFFDKKRPVETVRYKNGPGHSDFSSKELFMDHTKGTQYLNPVIILTSKVTFSAGNEMVTKLTALPHVTTVGETTGGGGSRPYHAELPNGWIYRFSGNIIIRPADGLNTDNGIPPDHYVKMHYSQFKDVILDHALQLVN